ncbi:hypothetical protein L6259_01045 [Candidatus Parcubacteria bacterium]|nr:hypothetical protein [Patescibacteria group bacterium]MCG2693859.1 hypothetical protein [Candidatus Parcubacteria bacterium]
MPTNKKMVSQIKQMFDIDQDIRTQAMANKNLNEPLASFCSVEKNVSVKTKLGFSMANFLIYSLDAIHNTKLHRIIEDYGYPNAKILGKAGLYYFWLLIQHQDEDVKLQEDCLKNCNFAPKEKAFLTDRILVRYDKKQIYGTQFFRDKKTGKMQLRPVENLKDVNTLRKEAGIKTTVEEDLKTLTARIKK